MDDMGFMFEDLRVYKKAMAMAKEILRLTNGVPRQDYSLADQLRRAATSIPANLAEGCGRWYPRAKRNFYRIALGSAYECVPFVDLAFAQKIIGQDDHQKLRSSLSDIGKMITALIEATK